MQTPSLFAGRAIWEQVRRSLETGDREGAIKGARDLMHFLSPREPRKRFDPEEIRARCEVCRKGIP